MPFRSRPLRCRGVAVAAVVLAAALGALFVAAPAETVEGTRRARAEGCRHPAVGAAYTKGVLRALAAGSDVWGNALLRSREGPTYEGVRRYLKPLLLGRAARRRPPKRLTASGVHYLAFGQPLGVHGASPIALHVADGSQVLSRRIYRRRLTIELRGGQERYGQCLSRLAPARLADGYLPILQTGYVDAEGTRYRQESFAARIPETRALVSFIALTADARSSAGPVKIRVRLSSRDFTVRGNRLLRGGRTHMFFGSGGRSDGSSVAWTVPVGGTRTVYAAWLVSPAPSEPLVLDEARYSRARASVASFWNQRLGEGATLEVPEREVMNAMRNLLVQNLTMTWRYSVGNDYEQFSFPESIDTAEVLGEYGFGSVDRAILLAGLPREIGIYPNWERGIKLVGSAVYYRLYRDRAYVERATPVLRRAAADLRRQLPSGSRPLLPRERFSSDIHAPVYGLHAQAMEWQGLQWMAQVWADTGHPALAAVSRRLAARLGAGLRHTVRLSARRLRDGSLFVPVALLDGGAPFRALTASRPGSYWNLVMPFALASGVLPPGAREARGVLRYMLTHGSRFLGLVRAAAFGIYGKPTFPTSGTDQVYGVNVARFLADNGESGQLELTLYGHLAAGMTQGTFVSGEGAGVAPVRGEFYRKMYRPPNSTSNSAFLETLRLLLIQETRASNGVPHGLRLAYATPRAWLAPGKRIVVEGAPTSFGEVSFSLRSVPGTVLVSLTVPPRRGLNSLRLRLRLPRGRRIEEVELAGQPYARFDRRTGTIDLSGRRGRLELVVRHEPRRASSSRAAVRLRRIPYVTATGAHRSVYLTLPAWYGSRRHPSIPLVISPHGRGLKGRTNVRLWGNLPALGPFAVASPDGQGRRLFRYSWGFPGQIDDLARMPRILERAVPWLRLDRRRIYAFGGSMGGQEVLLLAAHYPRLLAGVAAFDPVADFAVQYRHFPRLRCNRACLRQWVDPIGIGLQGLARLEVGGSPADVPQAYAARSPITYAGRLVRSCIPLQLWWSVADLVIDQRRQTSRLFWKLRRMGPRTPITGFVGSWIHSTEMSSESLLPLALGAYGLVPPRLARRPPRLHIIRARSARCTRTAAAPTSGG